MSMIEVKDKVNQLANSWEEFKSVHQIAIKDSHGKNFDSLTLDQLTRINESLDAQQDNINRLEAVLMRPAADNKSYNQYADLHKKAFNEYLTTGNEQDLRALEKRSLSSISDTDGGYFITQNAIDVVTASIEEYSPMRKLANVTTISGDALEVIEDFDYAYAGWVSETETRDVTRTPILNKKIISVHEMYAQPKATQKLIDDASIDIEDWLTKKLTDAFQRIENSSFIYGDGIGKPRGLLTYPDGLSMSCVEQIHSGRNGEITTEGLFSLFYGLKENFAVKGKFLMSRAVLQACRLLIDPISKQHIWNPGIEGSPVSTLLGCEVVQSADMPGVYENSLAIAYGDFASAYQIVDRQGISILRDPFTDKPFVKFYATKRVGGSVLNGQAVKLLKLSQ